MKILDIGNLNRMGESYSKVFKSLGHSSKVLIWSQSCAPISDKRVKAEDIYKKWSERFPHPFDEIPKESALFRFMWKAADEYDLFICHFAFQSAIFANMLKKLKGIKYVLHVRGSDIRVNLNHPIYGRLMEPAIKNAEMVWCSTPDLVKYTKRVNEKSYWIPNVVDTEIFRPKKRKVNLKMGRELSIFFPSRQQWSTKGNDKAIRVLIRVLKKSDALLHMIDHGPDASRSKELIRRLSLESHVKWHKKIIDQRKLADMYNSADVVWDDFSDIKTIGMVGMEAMACNVPLVSKNIDQRLYTEPLPIVRAGGIEDFAKKTLSIKNYRRIIKKERSWVVKYCTFNAVRNRVKNLLDEVMQ